MRVKTLNDLQPRETPAQSVIIEDDKGNPIIVAMQLTESIIYATAGDPDFQSMLQALGVNKTVHVTQFNGKPLEDLIWTP
jgi:hypothetical protein